LGELVNTAGFRARTREKGKHRTEDAEVTEVTEAELQVVDKRAWVDTAGFRARTRESKRI
jgi:hypothetical protein